MPAKGKVQSNFNYLVQEKLFVQHTDKSFPVTDIQTSSSLIDGVTLFTGESKKIRTPFTGTIIRGSRGDTGSFSLVDGKLTAVCYKETQCTRSGRSYARLICIDKTMDQINGVHYECVMNTAMQLSLQAHASQAVHSRIVTM